MATTSSNRHHGAKTLSIRQNSSICEVFLTHCPSAQLAPKEHSWLANETAVSAAVEACCVLD